MNNLKNKFIVLQYFLTFLIAGCSYELTNLSESKSEVEQYYKDGFYGKETYDVIESAFGQISELEKPVNSLVVFDVDETVLSNYKHIKEVDFGYIVPLWDEWILASEGENIPQVKKLYDYLIEHGIGVAFLTARNEKTYDATYKNLVAEGFTKFDTLICKSTSEKNFSSAKFKEIHRKNLSEKGFNIIATIGDQWSDLEGDFTGIKVKIPNYLYIIK